MIDILLFHTLFFNVVGYDLIIIISSHSSWSLADVTYSISHSHTLHDFFFFFSIQVQSYYYYIFSNLISSKMNLKNKHRVSFDEEQRKTGDSVVIEKSANLDIIYLCNNTLICVVALGTSSWSPRNCLLSDQSIKH